MNLHTLEDFNIECWYRGLKKLKPTDIKDNEITFSNGDKITIQDNNIYLNKQLICNDTITEKELIETYKYYLLKKGYKFL